MMQVDPEAFIISRKRKKYRFALFANSPLCFEADEWPKNSQPNVLEIGAGTGQFSVALATQSPVVQHVAVDVKADRLQTGAAIATEHGLANVCFLRAHASQLADLISLHSLDTIWITFPDPFPKNRSAKHRLTYPNFLGLYQKMLKKDGALYFKTDASALFTWSLEQLVHEGWRIEELSFDLHESDLPAQYKIQTVYETRFTGEGLAIHFVKAMPPLIAPIRR
jgi:tRNA (guanine-N7-)-methyltransferase